MDSFEPRFQESSSDLEKEVALANERSPQRAGFDLLGARGLEPGSAYAVLEGEGDLDLEQVCVEDWLETQLLDCLNLARRHGLSQVANVIDVALDVLARDVEADTDSPAEWNGETRHKNLA